MNVADLDDPAPVTVGATQRQQVQRRVHGRRRRRAIGRAAGVVAVAAVVVVGLQLRSPRTEEVRDVTATTVPGPTCADHNTQQPAHGETFSEVSADDRSDGSSVYFALDGYLEIDLSTPTAGSWLPGDINISPAGLMVPDVQDESDSTGDLALSLTPTGIGTTTVSIPCSSGRRPWTMTMRVGTAFSETSQARYDPATRTLDVPGSDLDSKPDAPNEPTQQYGVFLGTTIHLQLPIEPATTWGPAQIQDITSAMSVVGTSTDSTGHTVVTVRVVPNSIGYSGTITVPCSGAGCTPITINILHFAKPSTTTTTTTPQATTGG